MEIAELADHRHAARFLRLDQCAVKELDQRITRAGMQRVLPQLDEGGENG